MSLFPGFAMQSAVFAVLKANAALAALVGARIYDAVPANAVMPYVTYGPVTVRDWPNGDLHGHEHIISISVLSREPGFRQAYAAADAVRAVLHGASLTLSGHSLVLLRCDSADFAREADTVTTRATLLFRALTEKS